MKIGFTGTHWGMTAEQMRVVDALLWKNRSSLSEEDEFHHGDCVGADNEAAELATELCFKVVAHPPREKRYRANHPSDVILPEKNYLDRDHDIVNAVDLMIAAPHEFHNMARSGTWATIRYARARQKHTIIVFPDGSWQTFGQK